MGFSEVHPKIKLRGKGVLISELSCSLLLQNISDLLKKLDNINIGNYRFKK